MTYDPATSKAEPAHHSAPLYNAGMFSWAAAIARILPLKITRLMAALLGRVYALTHTARVDCVLRNLRLLDSSLKKERAHRLYAEFAKTMADYFYIGTREPDEAVQIITERVGYEYLDALHQAGTGALIVTAHLGLFELGGLLMAHSGFPAAVLTLPEPSSSLTNWRARAREKWGVETIEVGDDPFTFLHIAKRLREGCFVAALIDRPTTFEPTAVIFPHGTTNFSAGILLVAAQCGVPVVPTTMVRQADGFYRAEVFEPIYIESRGNRNETLQFYTQKIADTLKPTLCAHPEQWFQFVPLS
jgi:lauroyl/myristoyl acyltransferase